MRNRRSARWLACRAAIAAVLAASALLVALGQASADPAPTKPRIINGDSVDQTEFDARYHNVVGIIASDASNEADGQFCGGSLIDDDIVLTAAHCVTFGNNDVVLPGEMDVVVGRHDIDDDADATSERLAVTEVYVHPRWGEPLGGEDSTQFDMALLRLELPVTQGTPIDLIANGDYPSLDAGTGLSLTGRGPEDGPWVVGWGEMDAINESGNYPDNLFDVQIPVAVDSTCTADYDAYYGGFVGSNMLCAGIYDTDGVLNTTNGKDSCYGDSGGPLQASNDDGVTWQQLGIVSWGNFCGSDDTLGVYTDLDNDSLRDFANGMIGEAAGPQGIEDPGNLAGIPGQVSMGLDWDAPAGGPAPASYRISARAKQGYGNGTSDYYHFHLKDVAASSTSTTVTGLVPSRPYVFYVQAMNAPELPATDGSVSAGTAAGATIAVQTLPDTSRPTRPGRPYLRIRTRTAINIGWRRATDNHRVARHQIYIYRWGRWRRIGSRTTRNTFTATNLVPGVVYKIRIRAVDPAGNTRTGDYRRIRTIR